jgi:hypothetical protein
MEVSLDNGALCRASVHRMDNVHTSYAHGRAVGIEQLQLLVECSRKQVSSNRFPVSAVTPVKGRDKLLNSLHELVSSAD